MAEIYKLKEGKIMISYSDKSRSFGKLCLDPRQELAKHNRPVDEILTQESGSSIIKLFDGDKLEKEVQLAKGDPPFVIPANKYHIHSNATDFPSCTKWEFLGDITEIIDNIRKNSEKIPIKEKKIE